MSEVIENVNSYVNAEIRVRRVTDDSVFSLAFSEVVELRAFREITNKCVALCTEPCEGNYRVYLKIYNQDRKPLREIDVHPEWFLTLDEAIAYMENL